VSENIEGNGPERKEPVVWKPATTDDLIEITAIHPIMTRNALVYRENGKLAGCMTYLISEPDEQVGERHMYVEWWTILEGFRSPRAASTFLSNLYSFLKEKNIDIIDFEVRDMPEKETYLNEATWNAERAHRENLIAVYTKITGSAERVDEIHSTLFSCAAERVGEVAKRGAFASLFSPIP
jgi:hypothetical protein